MEASNPESSSSTQDTELPAPAVALEEYRPASDAVTTNDDDDTEKKVPPLRITLSSASDASVNTPTTVTPASRSKGSGNRKNSSGKPLTRARNRQSTDDGTTSPKKRTSFRTPSSSLLGGGTGSSAIPDEFEDAPTPDQDKLQSLKPPISPPTRAYELIQDNSFAANLGLRNLVRQTWSKDQNAQQPEEPKIPNYDQYMLNIRDYIRGAAGLKQPKIPVSSKWPLEVQFLFLRQCLERRKLKTQQETERTRLQLFGESEFLRAKLSSVTRERTMVNAMRVMRDESSCNPLNFDHYHPEPAVPSMKPETPTQVFSKIRQLAFDLHGSQIMERDAVIQRQRSEFFNVFRLLKFSDNDSHVHSQHSVLPWRIPRVNFAHVLDPDNPELSDDEETELMKALEESLSKKIDFDFGTVTGDD